MPTRTNLTPDRETRLRRIHWALRAGIAILMIGILAARLTMTTNSLGPRATEICASFAASVLIMSGYATTTVALVALTLYRDFSRPWLLFILLMCALIVTTFGMWVWANGSERIEARDARITFTIYKALGTSGVLSAPMLAYEIPVTVVGPQTAIAALPLLAVPVLLLWPARTRRKSAAKEAVPPEGPTPA